MCVCVCVCERERERVCVCVHANWLWEWPIAKKAHNFQMDSHTCTKFSGKVGNEPKDS